MLSCSNFNRVDVKDVGYAGMVEQQGEARFRALIFALPVLQTGHLKVTQ